MNLRVMTAAGAAAALLAVCLVVLDFRAAANRVAQTDEDKPPSGAMQALDFFAASRAYPQAAIPDEGHYRAFEYSKSSLRKTARHQESTRWELLGPLNVGGRTNAIAFNPENPRTLYVGSASGGLWRSFSAGIGVQAWEYVETGFPVLGVSAIAFAPGDSNVIYLGTGEVYGYQNSLGGTAVRTTRGSYGIGILKTTDGGRTWSKSLDWSLHQRRGVQALAVHPLNPALIFAGTTEGTFKSTDAGNTWQQAHNVVMAMDVDLNPRDPNIVFVACGNLGSAGAGIYRSRDAGASWEKLTNGLPATYTGKTSLDIFTGDPNIIYADVCNDFRSVGIYASVDGGSTWERRSAIDIAQYQGWYSHFVLVHPANANIVMAGGIDLWKSTDGGRTFSKKSDWAAWQFGVVPIGGPEGPPDYSHADHHAALYHPLDPSVIYFTNDGGVFYSADGGETFTGANGGYATTQFYNGFSCSTQDSNLALGGLQDNSTVIFEGTPAWRRVIGGDGCWTAIDPNDDDVMYGEAQNLFMFKSEQRGHEDSWFAVINGINTRGSSSFVAPFVISANDGQVLYAGTNRVYKTTNAAGFWFATNADRPLDGNSILSLAISATSHDTVFAGTAPRTTRARIFRTVNGGATWEDVTGALPDRYPMDLAIDPTNARRVYAVFSGFGTSHLFKSEDAGLNWIDLGGALPDVPSSAILIDPQFPQHLYFGNDLGVYASTDGGASWQEWSAGLPTVLVMDLALSPANRKLRVATHGNGVWQRPLIGAPATRIDGPQQPVLSFLLRQNHPNPLAKQRHAETRIVYELRAPAEVRLNIHNTLGQTMQSLALGPRAAGRHEIRVEGKNLSPGVYYYTLTAGQQRQTRKMLVLD